MAFTHYYMQNTASLVAQLAKNLPAVQETWIRSLGRVELPKLEFCSIMIKQGFVVWAEVLTATDNIASKEKSILNWRLIHLQIMTTWCISVFLLYFYF